MSYAAPRESIPHQAYSDAVVREFECRVAGIQNQWDDRIVTSIFFGGGTPSLWDASAIERVIARVRNLSNVSPSVEITVECNPTSLDITRANALADAGVNRLSIGTQSLDRDQLKFLGRLHTPDGATTAVREAMQSRVARVSTDMIFALAEQSSDNACAQAEALADLGLRHLSCYQLTIEPGTQFGELAKRGRLPLADEAVAANTFVAIGNALEARGFVHYEISNYAMPGDEARHNIAYWRGDEYLGLGCGAFGFVRRDTERESGGIRYRNDINPASYMTRANAMIVAPPSADDGVSTTAETLDTAALLRERIMLGLRMCDGVDLDKVASDLKCEVWTSERKKSVLELVRRERLVIDGGRIRIPKTAWLWTDDTSARLF